ncbi:MAG: peptide chain release factor N(5)-glutamine methyltransferase [Clostridiales bacterium]|nr:peptide chain release factor N(5)-glutamine methyltransferase [Clostridiales bacterium]
MENKVSTIGGQALLEGVMMRGQSSMAMSVRDSDGIIRTESERLKPQKWYNRVPIFRGVAAFISSLYTGISTLTRSAKVLGDEEEQLSNGAMTFAVFVGLLFAVVLFVVVPELIARLFNDYVFSHVLVKSLIAGVIRIAIFVLYLLLVSRMKDIKRTFMYHGAEHRTINCYESGMDLTVENVQKCSTRHNRCGTTFLFIVMVVSILIFAFINWILDLIFGGVFTSKALESLVYIVIKLIFLPLVAGISYEVLKGVAKMPDNRLAKILRAPGLALQALTTAIPDDDMAEVAIRSFITVMKMEENENYPSLSFDNIKMNDARAYIRRELPDIEPVEADWILCEVFGINRGELAMRRYITVDDLTKVKEICARRKSGEPLDYIAKTSHFYGYDLHVNSNVLIPRMETEILVTEAINAIGEKNADVLDLCTGSGCIAYALAANTSANIIASDISDAALEVAAKNLAGTNVILVKSDLLNEFAFGSFDVIVSNPPYIRSAEIDLLAPEVKRQPRIALDGGEDGLEFYKKIITAAPSYLRPGGKLLLEIGHDQAESVKQILYTFRYRNVRVIQDLDGNDRVIIGQI